MRAEPTTLGQLGVGDQADIVHLGVALEVTVAMRLAGWVGVYPVEKYATGRDADRIMLPADYVIGRRTKSQTPVTRRVGDAGEDPLLPRGPVGGGCLAQLNIPTKGE